MTKGTETTGRTDPPHQRGTGQATAGPGVGHHGRDRAAGPPGAPARSVCRGPGRRRGLPRAGGSGVRRPPVRGDRGVLRQGDRGCGGGSWTPSHPVGLPRLTADVVAHPATPRPAGGGAAPPWSAATGEACGHHHVNAPVPLGLSARAAVRGGPPRRPGRPRRRAGHGRPPGTRRPVRRRPPRWRRRSGRAARAPRTRRP